MKTNAFPMGVCMCVLALGAGAATLTYDTAKAGAWGEASSWVENAAPAAGDTLVIPGDARLTDADAAAAGLADQITVAADATLTVDNAETLAINGFVSGDGRLVKLGAGLLDFTKSPTTTSSWEETKAFYLAGGTVISNGTLRYAVNTGHPGVTWNVGPLSVHAPGVLDVPANCNFQMKDLSGDGTILNSRGTLTQLRPTGTSVFDGFLSGSGLRVYTQADIAFNCLTNTIAYDEFATWGGRITLPLFGMRGQPAPVGPNATLRIRDNGGTFRYSGTGETTDRVISFFHAKDTQFCALDGGPNGGVTFAGRLESGRENCWNMLVLTGDNAQPMTLAGGFSCKIPIAIVKRGTGTWYFRDAANNAADRQQKGLYEVEDGVLAFDSVANVGVACALGPQTALVPRTNPYDDITTTVDTAFILGGAAGKTGTLRHVGAKASATDRLIGVAGKGRLENASDASLVWNGGARATGAASQPAELVLAGDTAAANVIANLRDGDDGKPLAVTKEGTGTWTLGAGTVFSGKLAVKAGTVQVSPTKGAFTWYKWTIRETWGGRLNRLNGTGGDTNAGARKIAFYDADGNDLSTGRFTEDTRHVVSALQPNTMTYDGDVIRTFYPTGNSAAADGNTGRNLDRLVDGQVTEWLVNPRVTPTRSDNAASWFSVVFRFPEGTPPAASYDVWSYGAGNPVRSVCAWTLYGSDDGTTWYELDRQDLEAVPDNWLGGNGSGGTVSPSPFALVDADDPSAYGLPNASVAVAAGAALVAGRTGLSLPSRLAVEPGVPHGRYAGFAVPKDGVVDIRAPLSWYRLTVLETVGGRQAREGNAPSDQNTQMDEFALYDAKGARRNAGLQLDPACDPAALQPGCVTYSRSGINYYGNRNADKLFDDKRAESGWCVVYGSKFVRRDDPSSWIQLTMRLADEDPGIASYDWVGVYGPESTRTVSSWRLEGSADGTNWITLDEQLDYEDIKTAGKWWFDGAAFAPGQVRAGFPVSTDGMKGLVSLRDLTVPIDLADCTDVGNLAKWKVCINGVEVPRVKMAYHDGALRALQSSTVIIFR